MDLVDRYRFAPRIGVAPEIAMRLVAPWMRRRHRRDRSGGRAQFRLESERIGLERQAHAIGADDLVFVGPAGADVGNEQFPDAGVATIAHRMPAAVPLVEVAD